MNRNAENAAVPGNTHKPWTRWWWMGSAVTKPGITRHLEQYAAAGFGGVEITPIYGVRGQEEACIDYAGPAWFAMLAHTIREAGRLGLGVDMTLGTGWPYGGKHVRPEHAPRQVAFHKETIPANTEWRRRFDDAAIEAAAVLNPAGGLDPLAIDANGHEIVFSAPAGGAILYLLLSKPTGQQVKRPAPGGEGDVMSPYSTDALMAFLEPFQRVFEDASYRPRCIFYDSFEVFGADFTPGILDRFQREKGYDLRGHLHALMGDADAELVGRVRCDYRDVLFSCLLYGFVQPWTAWAHLHGISSRYQAHGSPGNWLDLYASADIPETEVFGASHFPFVPIVSKMASSAAHLSGKRLVSSETFTWQREHFQGTLASMKPELDRLFLAGINHVFFHGTAYSPESAGWPGWLFYASTHFEPAQPFWRDLPAFNGYIADCQRILQGSRPAGDILLYFPFHDAMSLPGDRVFRQFNVHELESWLTGLPWGDVALRLWDDGYAFDVVSDLLLETLQSDGGRIRAAGSNSRMLVVPPCRSMPLTTLRKITSLARSGAMVVFLQEYPASEPGLAGLQASRAFVEVVQELRQQCRLAADHASLMDILHEADVRPAPLTPIPGLKAVKLDRGGDVIFFLCNFSAQIVDQWVAFAVEGDDWVMKDPLTGRTGRPAVRRSPHGSEFHLALQPGESLFILEGEASDLKAWPYARQDGDALRLAGTWDLHFIEGGPTLPQRRPLTDLRSWTDLGDPAARDFSGTARYTLSFEFDAAAHPADAWYLRFREVRESARILLNDRLVGTLWCPPWEAEVTGLLRPGPNTLVCEVTNLAANRIAAMDRRGIPWRVFHDANVVSADYKPFDASQWPPMPSGLIGEVSLAPMAIEPVAAGASTIGRRLG